MKTYACTCRRCSDLRYMNRVSSSIRLISAEMIVQDLRKKSKVLQA